MHTPVVSTPTCRGRSGTGSAHRRAVSCPAMVPSGTHTASGSSRKTTTPLHLPLTRHAMHAAARWLSADPASCDGARHVGTSANHQRNQASTQRGGGGFAASSSAPLFPAGLAPPLLSPLGSDAQWLMSVFLNCLRFFSRTAAPLPEPEDLSESELRQALQAAGVEPLGGGGGGGGEKQDQGGGGHRPLLEAQYRALVARKMAAANPGSRTLRREQCALGPFDCRVLNNFGAEGLVKHKDARLPVGLVPDVVVVALHGFGAAADQFESVFEGLLAANAGLAKRRLLIVCPQAKQLNGSPAWFPLDIMAWMMLFAQGEGGIARLIREEPPGMAEGRREILRCCEAVLGFCGFTDYSRVILTGFSQGAMMANDVGLHLPTPPLAIVSLSGIPLIVDRWTEKARQKAFQGLKVFVAHGRADQLLPFQASVWLHGLHSNNGLDATHHPHSGGHDIGGPADIAALAEYLHKTVGDHAPGKTAAPGKAVKVTAPAAAAAAGGGGGGAAAATEAVPAPAPVAAAAVDSDIFAAAAAAAAVAEDGGDGGDSASGE